MSTINIVTYNILSPELSEPETFPENTAEEVDGKNRLPRIIQKLKKQISNNAIISLQEVSITWLGRLHELFDLHNYHFTHTLYGGFYSGYMGVGLAFPRSLYSLETFEISRISDTKEWPRLTTATATKKQSDVNATTDSVLARTWNYSAGYIRNVFDPLFVLGSLAFGSGAATATSTTPTKSKKKSKQEDPPDVATFYQSKKRWNQAILLRLQRRSDNQSFCVTNYHNPCAIHLRPVITFHACMYVMKCQTFAKQDPLIICGDFNMTPDSGGYKLVTTGTLDVNHEDAHGNMDYPKLPIDDPWKPNLYKMKSAYKEILGNEPKITNKAVRLIGNWGATPNAFEGCLDYIFYSNGLEPVDTTPFPSAEELNAVSYPTSAIPSDHLLMGCSFNLKSKEEESKL